MAKFPRENTTLILKVDINRGKSSRLSSSEVCPTYHCSFNHFLQANPNEKIIILPIFFHLIYIKRTISSQNNCILSKKKKILDLLKTNKN